MVFGKARAVDCRTMSEVIECFDVLSFLAHIMKASRSTVYRGQTGVDWPLVPSLSRPWKADELTTREERKWRLELIEKERGLIADYRRRLPGLYPGHPSLTDIVDLIAFGQHNDLETRAMDWSWCAINALFFAVDNVKTKDDPYEFAVWALETIPSDFVDDNGMITSSGGLIPFDFFNSPRTMFLKPIHVTDRIRAQDGLFSIQHISQDKAYPLNDLKRFTDRLVKYVVNSPAETIRRECDRLGVNKAKMYPDAQNMAKHLNWVAGLEAEQPKRVARPAKAAVLDPYLKAQLKAAGGTGGFEPRGMNIGEARQRAYLNGFRRAASA